MQNRYVGDIGDYVKLAILRQLALGRKLGVAWWLFPDEIHNNDGGHRQYLQDPNMWRRFDRDVFDGLLETDKKNIRDVTALEPLLSNAVFATNIIPCDVPHWSQRPAERLLWIQQTKQRFKDRDFIFLDPDNGIASEKLRPTQRRAGKSVFISDLQELKESHQAALIYHHHSMRKGGHVAELHYLAGRLTGSGFHVLGALRAKPWSPRAFFILGGDKLWNDELCTRAQKIERLWDGRIEWHSRVSLGVGT